jgi:UDPglucose 6-dehydrogenase
VAPMKVTVVGTGYVGLVAGACFADVGVDVTCVDIDENKLESLRRGVLPFFEPHLAGLIDRNHPDRLSFSSDLATSLEGAQAVFIAVGTPAQEDGSADLRYVSDVAASVAAAARRDVVLVLKSTVPVGTNARVRKIVESRSRHKIAVVSNPEFLKEGDAVNDFLKPDRIVIGTDDEEAFALMRSLYAPFNRRMDRMHRMSPISAEIVKYAANAFLATKVSFINEIAHLCDVAGGDVEDVRLALGADHRIGLQFLYPGIGFGGSCFPKDLRALLHTGKELDVTLLVAEAAEKANAKPIANLLAYMEADLGTFAGKVIAVWGLAFKPKTDDVRESAALRLIAELVRRGATVRATDPEASATAQRWLDVHEIEDAVTIVADPYAACDRADAVVLATEWNEYRSPDFMRVRGRMRGRHVYDGRNVLLPSTVTAAGLAYRGIGRPPQG